MPVDEEQPLLGPIVPPPCLEDGDKHTEIILDFDPSGDPENPKEWSPRFKSAIVLLLACMAFSVTFTCISVVPLANSIVDDLDNGESSSSAAALMVTIWELGEAAGPLLIAPLSEVFGRYPVMNVCNIWFIIATILAALSQSSTFLIAMRAMTGLAVCSAVLGPAIIGDIYESDERGSAMSLIMLAPLLGGAVGPAFGGVIAQTLGWRQLLFIAAGIFTACEVLLLLCFQETYKLAILRRRVTRLQIEAHGRPVRKSEGHDDLLKIWHSITRPFAVLFGSGVLMALSLFGSVAFSYFYVMSITLSEILQDVYGFSLAQIGSSFMAFSIGSACGVAICNFTLDRIYIRLRGPNKSLGKPEFRLPIAILGAFGLPLALTIYGWIPQLGLPAPFLLVAVALLGFTLLLTVVPLSAYVVDAFGVYSASAMTGLIVTRCLMGTFLPLAAKPLTELFGYGWGFTCLGAVSLGLAPIPVVVFWYGEKWRGGEGEEEEGMSG